MNFRAKLESISTGVFKHFTEKGLACFIFLVVPLLVGLVLPYFLLKPSINTGIMPFWFKYVSAISTGLLFGISLLHLIPDCTGDMEDALIKIGECSLLFLNVKLRLFQRIRYKVSPCNGISRNRLLYCCRSRDYRQQVQLSRSLPW